MRTEFGSPRKSCACDDCKALCQFIPGMLIPSDLVRLVPKGVDPFVWAETNLRASPGAIAVIDTETGKQTCGIPTLVPAAKEDGSCVHLTEDGRCDVHENSPFGCAFFDCSVDPRESKRQMELGIRGLVEIAAAMRSPSLYQMIWVHLVYKNIIAPSALKLRPKLEAFKEARRCRLDKSSSSR